MVPLLQILEPSFALLFVFVGTGYAQADEEPKDKREAKLMRLLRKVQVLDNFHRRMGISAVDSHYYLTESTVHSI